MKTFLKNEEISKLFVSTIDWQKKQLTKKMTLNVVSSSMYSDGTMKFDTDKGITISVPLVDAKRDVYIQDGNFLVATSLTARNHAREMFSHMTPEERLLMSVGIKGRERDHIIRPLLKKICPEAC